MLIPAATQSVDEPLGKGRRLLVTIVAFVGLSAGFSSTYLYTAGLFLLPVATQFDLTRGQASLGPLFCALTAAAVTPLLGGVLDRFTALLVALLSLLGLASGFLLLASFSNDLESYIGFSVLLAILGSGSTPLPFSRLVLKVFERNRGMALGVVMTGTGFGALVLPPMLAPVIQGQGWRSAYQWLAVLPMGAMILLGVTLLPIRRELMASRRRAAPLPELPADQPNAPVWRSRSFQAIGGMFFVLAIASVGLVVHFVPILIGAGSSAVGAATTAGLIGLASIAGRLLMGFLLDRFPVNWLTMVIVVVAISGAALMLLDTVSFSVPAALMLGVVTGAESDLVPFYAIRYFPENRYGAAFGGIFGLYLVGGSIGPSLVAYLFDSTYGYQTPLLAIMALFVLSLVVVGTIPAPARRR